MCYPGGLTRGAFSLSGPIPLWHRMANPWHPGSVPQGPREARSWPEDTQHVTDLGRLCPPGAGHEPPEGLGARSPGRWSRLSMAEGRRGAERRQKGAGMGPRAGLLYGLGGWKGPEQMRSPNPALYYPASVSLRSKNVLSPGLLCSWLLLLWDTPSRPLCSLSQPSTQRAEQDRPAWPLASPGSLQPLLLPWRGRKWAPVGLFTGS